jgi:hypothetical protein
VPDADAMRLAVLIDSDNTTASRTTELLEEIAKYGTPTIKRAYGDWTTPHLVGWKEELLRHAIQPMQQFAYTRGKNSTDSALIIDAMDLLYAGNLEGFVIVSSDSDFTRLATRLRESGMTVYGLGRRSTPAPFVAACDRFIYLDLLSQEPQEAEQPASDGEVPAPPPPNLRRILSTAISSTSKDDGWSNLGEVGSYLVKSHAAFDPRDYGHAKLGELVRAQLLGLAPLRLQGPLVGLERALAAFEVLDLAIEVLLLLLEPLLLTLDLRSSLAVLLLGAGPQADRLVLRLEEDLLLPGVGVGAQPSGRLLGGLDRVGRRTLPQGKTRPEADGQCDEPDDRHEDHVHDPHPLCEVSFRPFVSFLSARIGRAVPDAELQGPYPRSIRRVDS